MKGIIPETHAIRLPLSQDRAFELTFSAAPPSFENCSPTSCVRNHSHLVCFGASKKSPAAAPSVDALRLRENHPVPSA